MPTKTLADSIAAALLAQPGTSLGDKMRNLWVAGSGLVPASRFSHSDHKRAYLLANVTGATARMSNQELEIMWMKQLSTVTFKAYNTLSKGFWDAGGPGQVQVAKTAPGAPVLSVARLNDYRSVLLNVQPPVSDGGSPILQYNVTETTTGLSTTIANAGGGTVQIDNIIPGTILAYTVTAVNAIGSTPASVGYTSRRNLMEPVGLSSFEGSPDLTNVGFAGNNISVSTDQFLDGTQSLRLASVSGVSYISYRPNYIVSGRGGYCFTASVFNAATVSRNFSIIVFHQDINNVGLGSVQGPTVAIAPGTWGTILRGNTNLPANFDHMYVRNRCENPAAGELYYFDKVGFFEGADNTWSL